MGEKATRFWHLATMAVCFSIIHVSAAVTVNSATQRLLMVDDNGLKSETALSLANSSAAFSAWIKISVPGKSPDIQSLGSLAGGTSTKNVYVPELAADNDQVTFEIYDNAGCTGTLQGSRAMAQRKIRRWKVYVVHDMHLDIGYTNYQETLINTTFPGYQDQNFTYITNTNTWAPNDQFRYQAEGSYLYLTSAWNARNADWIETLKGHLASGRLAYAASYMHECFEGVGTEELVRFNYFSQRFAKDKFGTGSTNVLYKSDDPGLSWANVDALAVSGIKYFMMRFNNDSSIWDINVYPRIFYIVGRQPENRILAYDGPHYMTDEFGFNNSNSSTPYNNVMTRLTDYQFTSNYAYDAIITDFTYNGDNYPLNSGVKDNIRAVNARFVDAQGRKCVYPAVISSTTGDYFSHMDSTYCSVIPTFKGSVENWWNYGAASTAYETARNRVAHEALPAAEAFASFAAALGSARYPYENLYSAWDKMVIYDEHTWGPPNSALDDQWIWKRNNACAADRLSAECLKQSLASLAAAVPAPEKSIVVFNQLSWTRSDVVRVQQAELAAYFDIIDAETGAAVKYQKLADNTVIFTAENVPGNGYKRFKVTARQDAPVFTSAVTATATTLENRFYKVTFDAAGCVSSILDKTRGNAELVDAAAPYKMNQFVYFTTERGSTWDKAAGFSVRTTNPITSAALTPVSGPVCGSMLASGAPAQGTAGVRRTVILYDSVPRIDFVNEVIKTDAPSPGSQDEEGFFVFPLNVPNFILRHEMPTGDMRPRVSSNINDPANEQFYSSSTDHYTVNRWIDASNQSTYGITLSPVNAPLVQYGERRSFRFSRDYNTAKPWVYSYVFNNKWNTNFQETQPSVVTFRYSLQSHAGGDWKSGKADRFGREAANRLQAVVVGAQAGSGLAGAKGQFVGIDAENVSLTAAKMAEANGDGMILRFNETRGAETTVTVDLGFLNPSSVVETDAVENDKTSMALSGGKISFTIKGYQWKTVRVKFGAAPAQVAGVSATMDASGTQVVWGEIAGAACYEVFRGTAGTFTPGAGSYLTTVSVNHCYDGQVKTGLTRSYCYRVRAVRAGAKGPFSDAAQAAAGTITDNMPPTAPELTVDFALGNRVSITWTPSTDNVTVKGYRIYRNGTEIKNEPAGFNSFLDFSGVTPGSNYTYTVRAYDQANNLSAPSNPAATVPSVTKPGNIAYRATVTTSTNYGPTYAGTGAIDGVIGIQDVGEWASAGETNPWIQLTWSGSRIVNKIILYDRNNLNDQASGGTLTFSDGTSITVTGIPNDGSPKEITFTDKTVTWVRFQVSGGVGTNNGLSEFEVYESPSTAVLSIFDRFDFAGTGRISEGYAPGATNTPDIVQPPTGPAINASLTVKTQNHESGTVREVAALELFKAGIRSGYVTLMDDRSAQPAAIRKTEVSGSVTNRKTLTGIVKMQGRLYNDGITVSLFAGNQKSPLITVATASDGSFSLPCSGEGNYVLVIKPPRKLEGRYGGCSRSVTIDKSANTTLPAVVLGKVK